MQKTLLVGAISLISALSAPLAYAHEFWLEPLDFTLDSGQELQVQTHVGQDFKGDTYAYNPNQFHDFSISDSLGKSAVEGRIGDMPAVQKTPDNDGLVVLNLFSTTQRLTYKDDGNFESFIESKGLDWVMERHAERGLPVFGFSEGYTRFAKALVAVNGGAGKDQLTGMPMEILALANPYTDDLSEGLPIVLYLNNRVLSNIQVDIFRKSIDGGDASKIHVTTDARGRAIIPVSDGGVFMINAVHMIKPSDADIERTDTVWHSLWASMTFEYKAR